MLLVRLSESKADEFIATLHVETSLARANEGRVRLWHETEESCDLNVCTPLNILERQHDLIADQIRVLTVAIFLGLRLYSGERSDDFLNNGRLADFYLISGTVLSTSGEVDLIEVERPEG